MGTGQLKIKLTGQEHQIDANTLVNILTHYNSLITLINNKYSEGAREINLKVKAPERGSFIINLELVEVVKTIFSNESVQYIGNIMTIIGAITAVYTCFKGKPIKEEHHEETVKIIHNYSKCNFDIETIKNIYNTPEVRSSISKSIETADEDTAIDGVELSAGNEEFKPIEIPRKKFSDLIYDDFDKENNVKVNHKIDSCAYMTIVTLSFDPKRNWVFIYNGNKLSMSVKDENLQAQINKGLTFAKGDAIKVRLEIAQEWSEEYNAYINKKYRILEVLEHIPRSIQGDLFGKDIF